MSYRPTMVGTPDPCQPRTSNNTRASSDPDSETMLGAPREEAGGSGFLRFVAGLAEVARDEYTLSVPEARCRTSIDRMVLATTFLEP